MTFSFLEKYESFNVGCQEVSVIIHQTSDGCKDLSFLVESTKRTLLFKNLNELITHFRGMESEHKVLNELEVQEIKDIIDGKYDS